MINKITKFLIKTTIFIIILPLILVKCNLISSTSSTSTTLNNNNNNNNNQCSWLYNGTQHIICQIKLIDKNGLNLYNFGIIDTSDIKKLDINCNDLHLYESQLPSIDKQIFQRLQYIELLNINSCKLLNIPNNIFIDLISIKQLTINTKNYEWGPTKILELNDNSFNGMNKLTELNLINNNIRVIPSKLLCPIGNLQIFNLTKNRIRSTDNLGIKNMNCNGGTEIQILDISYNELHQITDNWGISKLRRLQHLNLQYNNISELSGDAFAGLTSMRIVNLSHNHLEQLPNDLFINSKELREIHLQYNELYELPKGIFHRLEQLLVLDLSGNQLTSHHIDNNTFAGLIRLIVLNLSHNALTRIDYRTFKELYFLQILNLRNNSIGYIEDNSFLPLYNLHTLNLAENRLHTLNDKLFNGLFVLSKLTLNNNLINIIHMNVFKNCSDLKELDLSSNQIQNVPEALQDLSMLKTLDLGENQLTTFTNGSFRNLHQLTGLRLIDNQIGNITKGMFWDLPRLSVLNLAKNRIQNIERGTFERNIELEAIRLDRNFLTDINGVFATLASLLWLNLSENHLVWFDYAFIPSNLKWLDIHGNYIEALGNYYKLQEEIHLKTLDASHNRIMEISPMSIPNTIELLFINNNLISTILTNSFVDKLNLLRVDLYANQLAKLQLQQLRVAPLSANNNNNNNNENQINDPQQQQQQLPEFYLGGNPFQCDCSMEWLQRINNLTTQQHPKIMDLPNVDCIMPHSRGSPIRSLMKLKTTDFLCRYETHCFALCHCCDFDACDCEMTCPNNCTCYHDQTWGTNVVDCGGQNTNDLPKRVPMDSTIVYLDGNNFPILKNNAFIGRKNLKALYVNSSNVASIQNRTFANLISLQILHLEDNRLNQLNGYEFEHLTNLKELYLQNNLLSHIDNSTLLPLISLEILQIDGNRLILMPIWQLQIPQFRELKSLSLGRNQWSCRCKFLQELTTYIADNALIVQDSQDIYCVDGAIKRELDLNTTSVCSDYYAGGSVLQNGIPKSYIPLLAAALALIFLLVILIVVFVFRESVRIWLFAHYGVRVFGPRCEETEKLYDAVLLHSAKDSEFVTQSLVAELETGRPPLRICLQHRDLSHDATHMQILEASRVSRRIVILLSRNFLQTEWSRCELRRAVHDSLRGRPHKLVIVEEPDVLLEAESDVELLPYLKTSAVNRIRRNDRNFWDRLRYALPVEFPYRGNNYTLDHNHERIKQPSSPGILYRQAPPPAYFPDGEDPNYSSATTATPSPRPNRRNIGPNEIIHSQPQQGSPSRHQQQQAQQQQHHHGHYQQNQGFSNRPPSEHIYSSIDSDYSTLDNDNIMIMPAGGINPNHRTMQHHQHQQHHMQQMQQNSQTWRPQHHQQKQQQQQQIASSSGSSGTSSGHNPPPGHHVQAYLV